MIVTSIQMDLSDLVDEHASHHCGFKVHFSKSEKATFCFGKVRWFFPWSSSFRRYLLNPLYTGRPFHCYMLDASICHFRDVGSILTLLFQFLQKVLLANTVDPDQTPHMWRPIWVCTVCLWLFTGFQLNGFNNGLTAQFKWTILDRSSFHPFLPMCHKRNWKLLKKL